MLTFKLPAAVIPNFDGFALPILRIYGADGSSTVISDTPQFDRQSGILSFLLPPGTTSLGQAMDLYFARFLSAVTACGSQGAVVAGVRYFDSNSQSWKVGAPPLQPIHPLIVLHGILSCIEDAFPPTAIERLREDGGYDAVLGYDYDWTESPADIIPQMTTDLNAFGFRHVDIAAHSYGAVIAMAVAPQLHVSKIHNMILYGGPLDGAFISKPSFWYSVLANVVSISFKHNVTLVLKPDWFTTFEPGSARLQKIRSTMMAAPNAPMRVIKVAGTAPLGIWENPVFRAIYSQEPPTAYDGVVVLDSALLTSVQGQPEKTSLMTVQPATLPYSVPLSHTNLVPDRGIEQSDVAPSLAFEFNDADPASGLYPVGGGIVFMKGVGSASHVAFLYPGSGTASLELATLQSQYFSAQPKSVPTVHTLADATPPDFLAASLVNSPTALLTRTPTDTMQFDLTTSTGTVYPNEYTMNYYAFPPCSSCLSQSPTDIQRIMREYHPEPSRHGVRALAPH